MSAPIAESNTPKRILILMSDTGGGHRAAAEAIRDALYQKYPGKTTVDIVDVFVEYSGWPWKKAPEMYPVWINRGKFSWRVGFHFSNQKPQVAIMNAYVTNRLGPGLLRMYQEHPADVVVNVHPFMATPALRVLNRLPKRPKFITVVTDLVSAHGIWYQPRADRTLVPTQPAFEIGLDWGVPPDRMAITGLPVHPRFAAGLIAKTEARQKLGWEAELPAILLVGGGSGMGRMQELAAQIDTLEHPLQLIVVAGRNAALKASLEAVQWKHRTTVYGFMTNMPELMAAADVLVTKAGPATISEACMAGLPIILSDAIPGQEYGNVKYLTENGAGVYANTPEKVRATLSQWLARGKGYLEERSKAALKIATPDAVWTIVDEIMTSDNAS